MFLLCSDGLNKTVSDEEIARLLAHSGYNCQEAVKAFIHLALMRDASDNVTTVVVNIDEGRSRTASWVRPMKRSVRKPRPIRSRQTGIYSDDNCLSPAPVQRQWLVGSRLITFAEAGRASSDVRRSTKASKPLRAIYNN